MNNGRDSAFRADRILRKLDKQMDKMEARWPNIENKARYDQLFKRWMRVIRLSYTRDLEEYEKLETKAKQGKLF